MNERQKDLLANIVSREQFITIARKHRIVLPAVTSMVPELSSSMYHATGMEQSWSEATIWPLQRDATREVEGVYQPPTAVLNYLRSFKHIYQLFPHISREDPLKLAYTPDPEAAMKDKKISIAVGRFVRKFFPLFTDDTVRTLEAAHRAEMDPTLEIVTSLEDIEFVYRHMAGDTACMRYSTGHFNHAQYHPSAIYASPNFGVAVHRDAQGTVKSRAVIWTNPGDPDDKRYVRIYGDAALQRKLERAGYRMRGLKGAKVHALRDPAWEGSEYDRDRFVFPYIDPAGGIHFHGNKEAGFDARWAVRYDDDPDWIHLVTMDERKKLEALDIYTVDCSSQSGSLHVPLSHRGEVMVDCALTGVRFSRLEEEAVHWMQPDGTVGWVRHSEVNYQHVSRSMGQGSGAVMVYGTAASFEGRCLPEPWSHLLDTPLTLQLNNLVRLDPAHYPADRAVYGRTECTRLADDSWIKTKDAYQVQEQHGPIIDSRFIHKDDASLLRKMGYVSVHPTSGMKLMVHSTDTRLVTTAGGKKAIKQLHELVLMWDGQWEFARNVDSVYIGGFSVHVKKGDVLHREAAVVPHDNIKARIFLAGDEGHSTLTNEDVKHQFRRYFGRFLHKPEGVIMEVYDRASVSVESIIAAASEIVTMPPEQVRDLHYTNVTLGWAKSVMRCVEMNEVQRLQEIEMAEANATSPDISQDWTDYAPEPLPVFAQELIDAHQYALMVDLERVLATPTTEFMHAPRRVEVINEREVRPALSERTYEFNDDIPFANPYRGRYSYVV